MRRIKFTEQVKSGGDIFEKDDVRSLSDAVADRFIKLGWAEDAESGETGTRVPGSNGPIAIDAVHQKTVTT